METFGDFFDHVFLTVQEQEIPGLTFLEEWISEQDGDWIEMRREEALTEFCVVTLVDNIVYILTRRLQAGYTVDGSPKTLHDGHTLIRFIIRAGRDCGLEIDGRCTDVPLDVFDALKMS